MTSSMFGVQKTSVYGSFGEFTIGDGLNPIRVKYILTKIKPGNDGSWECELASRMKPWREVFNVEELSFDELLQRDLDDSRVAHDLIPYLLGASGSRASFFPPILAVIVPRKEGGTGIEQYYPKPNHDGEWIEKYEELFEFEVLKVDGEVSPLASLRYNRQRSAFIIVDGQHRAMAVLALHRQLNEDWGNNPFASYYDHIRVDPDQVKSIELPTCIIYFPDLHEGNLNLQDKGIDLGSVCREIFLVVNRSAKRVSESRELLLDDEDIAARLMRRTLSTLKNRAEDQIGSARIYAISYGDSDTEVGQKEVISGQLEYSSAIALHKVHCAISFGLEGAFRLDGYDDISDGRKTRNSTRPAEILLGTSAEKHPVLPRSSGKILPPREVDEVVEKLGALADKVLVDLFDKFRPFTVHNGELRNLRMRLSDVHARTQIEQKKAYTLIFEGSGARNVFESHFERLKDEKSEREGDGQTMPADLQSQITFCESVMKTLGNHEREFQHRRACSFFSINQKLIGSADNGDDRVVLHQKARALFQTLSTQAFQLGYTMAIFTVVEELKRGQSTTSSFLYQDRLKLVEIVTEVNLAALNSYFSPKNNSVHRTLSGYITEPRASVFDSSALGLRGLLKMSVDELNERQWRFFRYTILEIVHSSLSWKVAQEKMKQIGREWVLAWYKEALPQLVAGIISERDKYIKDAVEAAVNGREFELIRMRTEAEARGSGKSEEQIQQIVDKLQTSRKTEAKENALSHLEASLGTVEEKEHMVQRLSEGL